MDLDLYFKRIEWKGPVSVDFKTLAGIHQHHATRIPFENLDIQMGKEISLDLELLQKKMVQNRRGGYCFEQNNLFQAVLTQIGFDVTACEARVRMGRSEIGPRTHMLLIVHLKEGEFLADVGFGGDGLILPVPLDQAQHTQFLWKYRVVSEGDLLVLQSFRQERAFDLYAFSPQPRYPVDFEVANWYTSTHPQSRFVQTLTVQLPTPEARYILRNRLFVIERGGTEETRELKSEEELFTVLLQTFGLSFPEKTSFCGFSSGS
jgi:N-hydroxyarylamine O-acetyltransferase